MKAIPTLGAARLLHEGVQTLSKVECNGIQIDMDYLERTIEQTRIDGNELEQQLFQMEEGKLWKRKFGKSTKIKSREQLASVLSSMNYEFDDKTATGKMKADESVLLKINTEFTKAYLRLMKLEKALATSLKGIKREVDPNGRLHPAFNLHLVTTYRSSSDSPNFQNIPIRDPELGKLVRRCFIPSRGNRLVEIDYGGIEVKVAACYHKDPMMIRYLNNPEMDMHRDMAAQCYKLPKEEVDKLVRYCGKNMFVFPEFYGSYYVDCARHLWQAIQQMSLKTVSGVPLDKWLRRKGIDRLGHCNPELEPEHGTFELHIKEVEKNFWNNRFPVYRDWKKKWWGSYCDKGYYKTLTGFICSGVMNRKEVINYPVQGSAFHCLLWSLIRLQEFIEREGLETMLVGQIHDSIIADVPPSEFDYFIENAKRIMTKKITKHWKWINVPLEVEADACEVGETWFDKKPVKI